MEKKDEKSTWEALKTQKREERDQQLSYLELEGGEREGSNMCTLTKQAKDLGDENLSLTARPWFEGRVRKKEKGFKREQRGD